MVLFPFTEDEWFEISEACRAVVNATFAEDEVLCASFMEELRLLMASFRVRYGDLPILWETEADFELDPAQQVRLYERATLAASGTAWPTLSIRLALARVLLEDLHQPKRALRELLACQHEMNEWADAQERYEWSELRRRCTMINGQ